MNSLCHRYLNQNILPFVGREGELRLLSTLFRDFIEEGESKYVLITGESGGGKTRLVREFEDRLAQEFGETSIIVHARYLEGNVAALTPVINAFEACLAQDENLKQYLRNAGLLHNVQSDLSNAGGPVRSGRSESGAPPLQVLLDSFSEIAKRFPLALILEDVHNMDDLPLFDQFFLGLSSASKFVVLTERTGHTVAASGNQILARQHGTSEHLLREIALREERTSDVITLTDFGPEETKRLFDILFVLDPSRHLLDTVQTRTEGRPLSLRTMLRQLVTMGVLQYDGGAWSEDSEASVAIGIESDGAVPDSGDPEVLARFQREIERLNEDEQTVAMHGALLGEQFDVRLLRELIRYRLGDAAISDEMFQRSIDLLTFKSIIRRAIPSISYSMDSGSDMAGDSAGRETTGAWCFEFSHAHYWRTILESSRIVVAHEPDLVTAIVWIAGSQHLPLYSSAFLNAITAPFALTKSHEMLVRVEHFLHWASHVVQSIWSQEPQQALRLLVGLRPMRDEITWRFGPDVSEAAMGSLIDLHSLLVEAFLRNGSPIEAERDVEHAAVLERYVSGAACYSPSFKAIAKGRVSTLRALIHHSRVSYPEFERCSSEARIALEAVAQDPSTLPEYNLERARLLTLLTRIKGEALLNSGRFKEADALIEQGMPVARLLADSRFDEYSLYYRAAVSSKLKQDQNEQARELTSQIMALAKEHGNTLVETTFLFQAALAAFSTGDLKAATGYCDLGIVNGRRYGIRFVEIMSYLWRMIIAGVQQDVEKVKECSRQLAILVEDARAVAQSPNLLHRISLIEGRATAMNFLGRYHAALEFAEEAIQLAGSHQHDQSSAMAFAAWAQNEKALALIGLGRFEEALAVVQACLHLAGEQRLAERTARTALIMAYTGLGQFDMARREAEEVRAEYWDPQNGHIELSMTDHAPRMTDHAPRMTDHAPLMADHAPLMADHAPLMADHAPRMADHALNPYFLRFALAESRLLRLTIGRSDAKGNRSTERLAVRARLTSRVEEILNLVKKWDAPLLEEQIRKEFEDVLPKQNIGASLQLRVTDQASSITHATIGNASASRIEGKHSPLIRLYTFGSLAAESIAGNNEKEERAQLSGYNFVFHEPRQRDRDTKVRQFIALLATTRAERSDYIAIGEMDGAKALARDASFGVSRDSLIQTLWPDSDSANVMNALYTTVKRARAFLGNPEAIVLHQDGYSLSPIVETDCDEVLRHYAESKQARKRNALFSITFHYGQILRLGSRGPFLEGIYGSWLDGLRTRLTALLRNASIRLIQTELDRGLLERVEDICLKLLSLDEFDEEALRGLLIVCARRRQTTKLIKLFDAYSKKLKDEFRADPSHELRSLFSSLTMLAEENTG